MSRSWTPLNSPLPPELADTGPIDDPHAPYSYQVRIEGERLFQEELLRGADSEHRPRREAAYLVGSGHHARACVAEENGFLTQLPLSWFAAEGAWRLSPGYELHNRRFDRPIVPQCVACHGGRAGHRAPTRNRYHLPIAGGIGCERCHGPGERHVVHHQELASQVEGGRDQGRLRGDRAEDGDPTIINPARLSPERANDVCLQCHLQGDVMVYQPGADAFSFRPGDRLCDHRLDFLIQTDEPEAFGVASHGARMMRSRCFLESGRRLTCIHCHDPHRPAGAFALDFYDSKCLTCHTVESCTRPVTDRKTPRSAGCVSCHMPRRKTREGQHLVFTDHGIRRSPPDTDGDSPIPPPLKADAPVELVNFWPEADPHQSRLGSAYVKLHETMGPQRPALQRGWELLKEALQKQPEDRLTRFSLASAELVRHRSAAAIRFLQELVRADPDWHEARFRLAIAHDQMRRYPAAMAEYERLILQAPDWMEPYPLLVRLHLSQRNAQAAERLLKQQLSYQENALAWVNLALARHLRGAPLEECLAAIERALALDPRLATAFVIRAFLYAQAGQIEPARRNYQQALRLDPQNRDADIGLRALDRR